MKKSKKFVLAGLALLAAITMVLLPLAGCKTEVDTSSPQQEQTKDTNDNAGTGDNDSTNTEDNTSGGGDSGTVPETPAAKLVSISVTTPPTRTVYSVGQSFDPTGMVVTATYNDGESKDVTSLAKTDFDFSSAGVKTVIVRYSEGDSPVTKDFRVDVVNVEEPTKLTTYTSPNNTDDSWTYMAFGEWPQTEVVDFKPTTTPQSHGIFVDNYYVEGNDKYVKEGGKYYKVEPIVWRVLTTSYEAPEGGTAGNALLLAEKILTGGVRYYVDTSTRPITGAGTKEGNPNTVYPNNWQYSTIRAWLNGSYEEKDSQLKTYTGKGFLQTAFTQSAQTLIADTTVDNSAASTNPASNSEEWNSGKNEYACGKTTDKVFLLSEAEATTGAHLKEKDITDKDYGFDEYWWAGTGNTRIRVTTDYAKATGAYQGDSSAGYGGLWWLRSPDCDGEGYACIINDDGSATLNDFDIVYRTDEGVVPALSISLTGN